MKLLSQEEYQEDTGNFLDPIENNSRVWRDEEPPSVEKHYETIDYYSAAFQREHVVSSAIAKYKDYPTEAPDPVFYSSR